VLHPAAPAVSGKEPGRVSQPMTPDQVIAIGHTIIGGGPSWWQRRAEDRRRFSLVTSSHFDVAQQLGPFRDTEADIRPVCEYAAYRRGKTARRCRDSQISRSDNCSSRSLYSCASTHTFGRRGRPCPRSMSNGLLANSRKFLEKTERLKALRLAEAAADKARAD
jgi:hypothetical protein